MPKEMKVFIGAGVGDNGKVLFGDTPELKRLAKIFVQRGYTVGCLKELGFAVRNEQPEKFIIVGGKAEVCMPQLIYFTLQVAPETEVEIDTRCIRTGKEGKYPKNNRQVRAVRLNELTQALEKLSPGSSKNRRLKIIP